MSESTIGSLLDDWLSNIDILFNYCDGLAKKVNKLEDELKALKAEMAASRGNATQTDGNAISGHVSAQQSKTIREQSGLNDEATCCQNNNVGVLQSNSTDAQQVPSFPQVLYAVPREQNGKIILNIMATERKQVAPFLLRVMQNEAEVEYNKDFIWSVDMLETKLFAYVDYIIKSKDITSVTQLSVGHAVLDNNRWIITQKPTVQV